MNNIDTILLDFDGTLMDTAPDLALAINIVLENNNRPRLDFAKVRPFASTGTRGLIGLGFDIDESHEQYPDLREQFLNAYHENVNAQTQIFMGFPDVLDEIEKQGLKWGVVTNKPTNLTQGIMDHHQLSNRSACIIGSDMVKNRKPDPESLHLACSMINTTPEKCVYVGDAKRDIEAGQRAGMKTIAALYGYIPNDENVNEWNADHQINKPIELIDLL